ncbi:RNA 2',3'-cyclic phosphodiesterase [Virgibacillus salinus]|uniref:RNA 2',3'-cyclic phosphodiesterase n=1 Tax=Virgibacillus salinus TaxID=553311 RepID=A0A1H1APN0_9BACI|nr:RNA 2',3'-cyclic phosphodiesterase [Virgibacillus salinus]SDQ41619.1 2'-5' RNA ligase [Virgibacillus salinus]
MTNEPHYFIAIPLKERHKEYYSKWQFDLKEELPYKQWANKEDLHITLKFLGSVESNKLNQLLNYLNVLEKTNEFKIATGSLGFFGNPKKPRVLWVGVDKTSALAALHHDVEDVSVSAGFEKDSRPFSPHITLAKKWNGEEVSMSGLKEQYDNDERLDLIVNQVIVYRIFPARTPKYEVVAAYELKGEVD